MHSPFFDTFPATANRNRSLLPIRAFAFLIDKRMKRAGFQLMQLFHFIIIFLTSVMSWHCRWSADVYFFCIVFSAAHFPLSPDANTATIIFFSYRRLDEMIFHSQFDFLFYDYLILFTAAIYNLVFSLSSSHRRQRPFTHSPNLSIRCAPFVCFSSIFTLCDSIRSDRPVSLHKILNVEWHLISTTRSEERRRRDHMRVYLVAVTPKQCTSWPVRNRSTRRS